MADKEVCTLQQYHAKLHRSLRQKQKISCPGAIFILNFDILFIMDFWYYFWFKYFLKYYFCCSSLHLAPKTKGYGDT